jgi:hypothetical protein
LRRLCKINLCFHSVETCIPPWAPWLLLYLTVLNSPSCKIILHRKNISIKYFLKSNIYVSVVSNHSIRSTNNSHVFRHVALFAQHLHIIWKTVVFLFGDRVKLFDSVSVINDFFYKTSFVCAGGVK